MGSQSIFYGLTNGYNGEGKRKVVTTLMVNHMKNKEIFRQCRHIKILKMIVKFLSINNRGNVGKILISAVLSHNVEKGNNVYLQS